MSIKSIVFGMLLGLFVALIYFYAIDDLYHNEVLAAISMVWSALIGDGIAMYYDSKQNDEEIDIANTIIRAVHHIIQNPDEPCPAVNDDLELEYNLHMEELTIVDRQRLKHFIRDFSRDTKHMYRSLE